MNFRWPRFNPRERILVVLTLAVILCSALYVSVAEPLWRTISELTSEIAETDEEIAKYRGLLANREEILAHTDSLQKRILASGKEDVEQRALLREIENLVRKARLDSTSLQPQRTERLEFYEIMGLQLSAQGTPNQLAQFLYEMRQSTLLLRVDWLRVDAGADTRRIKATMKVVRILDAREAL